MESLSPELQNLVNEIARKNGFTNFEVDANKSVSNEGDGYIGILKGLALIDKDSDKKLNLVVKTAPTSENLRKQFPTRTCFLREIRIYDGLIPEFLKFQEEYNIPRPFTAVTKLYGYIDEDKKETLFLRNVKEDGYILCNRKEPLDSHHLSLVITEYARFHAISHAMKKLEPKRFEKMVELLGENIMIEFQKNTPRPDESTSDNNKMFEDQMNFFFGSTLQALKHNPKALEAIEKFKKEKFLKIMALAETEHLEKNNVICHADCWSANLLFKYEDEDKPQIPTKLCIIDWQMSMLTSPIHDFSYFLFISAGKNDLWNYMRYLQLYHTALSDQLTAFGLDPESVYSFKVFEKDFREKCIKGFFMCLVMLQQTLSEGKTHDFEEMAKDGKSVYDANQRKIVTSDLFKQRMGDLVEFLVDNELM